MNAINLAWRVVIVDPLQDLDLGDEGTDSTLRFFQTLGCKQHIINLVRRVVVVDPLQGLDLGDERLIRPSDSSKPWAVYGI
jgi:hypothetical protein